MMCTNCCAWFEHFHCNGVQEAAQFAWTSVVVLELLVARRARSSELDVLVWLWRLIAELSGACFKCTYGCWETGLGKGGENPLVVDGASYHFPACI
mmetsp:Transcript_62461/g.103916  ORF Transcript_62461/g.103916 Transcript_62461/m.103916 type:complete len:96 (-) Transcript_62461:353-640(-)